MIVVVSVSLSLNPNLWDVNKDLRFCGTNARTRSELLLEWLVRIAEKGARWSMSWRCKGHIRGRLLRTA